MGNKKNANETMANRKNTSETIGHKKHTNDVARHSRNQNTDSKDYSSFKIVLFYCSLIVFLPVVTFFLLKSVLLDSMFTLTEVKSNIYSAVGAVVALHVALGVYIYRAYFGDTYAKED